MPLAIALQKLNRPGYSGELRVWVRRDGQTGLLTIVLRFELRWWHVTDGLEGAAMNISSTYFP